MQRGSCSRDPRFLYGGVIAVEYEFMLAVMKNQFTLNLACTVVIVCGIVWLIKQFMWIVYRLFKEEGNK